MFIFPCSSALKSKTSFLSPVLNFHGNETSTAWKKGERTYQKKKFGYLQYYSFHCSTRCSSSQHIHHQCLKSIRFLYFSQESLTNSRGSRVQCRGRGSKVAVAGPKSRSRVQSRGRGSNVAAGENDLEFEVTEWKRVIWKKYKGKKIVFMHDTLR